GRIDEVRDLVPCALVLGGRTLRERVDAAMDVRVGRLVERPELVQHLPGLVRADRGIEIGERLAADLLLEDGEVGAQLARVELGLRPYRHGSIVSGRLLATGACSGARRPT